MTDVPGGPRARGSGDLVVVGAGAMGAWVALEARRDGWRTTLIDAYGAGHARATSGDETRIIRASHGSDPFYGRWARTSLAAWLELAERTGERLFEPAGVLWFAHDDDGFEAASEATLRAEGIPVERLSPAEVSERWPGIATDDLVFALFEPEAGLLMARRGVAAVERAFSVEGGRFELAWAQPGSADGRRMLDVVTPAGVRFAADEFVFAAGPWLPRLFPGLLGDRIRVTKQDVVFVGPPAGDDRFTSPNLPCWVDYAAAFYGIRRSTAAG